MNKKFSTLLASFLLAGGLFSTVDAVKITEVKEGRYYHMLRSAQYNASKWDGAQLTTTSKLYLHQTAADGVYVTSSNEESSAFWKVAKAYDEQNQFIGYSFTNNAGQTLTYTQNTGSEIKTAFVGNQLKDSDVSNLSGDAWQIFADEDGKIQLKMAYTNNADKNIVTFADYSTIGASDYVLAFDFIEADLADVLTAKQLNAKQAEAGGFKLQIGYLSDGESDNKFTAYSNLLGAEAFQGTLKAKGETADATTYALWNGKKKIVLTTATWDDQNTDHAGLKGLKFTLMTQEQYDLQLKRDTEGADKKNPVILTDQFQISKNDYNGYLEVVALADQKRYELLVSGFNNDLVLTVDGTAANAKENEPDFNNITNKTYVKFGAGNAVNMTAFAQQGYYTIVRKSDAKALAPICSGVGFVSTSAVQLDMPEGMWALVANQNINSTGTASVSSFKFVNRESKKEWKGETGIITINASNNVATNFYSLGGNLYELDGEEYYITAQALGTLAEGYADFGKTSQKSYYVGLYSPVWGGVAYLSENHTHSHQIGLDTDVENATAWRFEANDRASKLDKVTDQRLSTDSLYVIHTLPYYNSSSKKWFTVKDTLKAVSYKLKNTYGEYMAHNNGMYNCTTNMNVKNFVFKKVGDAYNMVDVLLPAEDKVGGYANFSNIKVYGGDSANKGLLDELYCMYDRTENDLFKVEEANAGVYRRLTNAIDTISIFRNDNASQLLYEEGSFLGLQNENQFEIAPAMLADAAYAPEETDRPQYLLAVDATIIPDGKYCPIHGVDATCEHASETKGWVEGRYLVNLKDSAILFNATKKDLHAVNPYTNTEGLFKLGFVQATHRNDSLIIASTEDQIYVGGEDYNVAKFAFKYVDLSEGSFVIETANYYTYLTGDNAGKIDKYSPEGYLKWMNGVVVVVNSEANADVFNMNEEEGRTPTANEEIAAEGVTVIAGNGNVTIAGAAGKKVVIANILGQTVANTVLTSDNATIAAPAGVVVVKVEGEAAVKAIVK